MVRKSNPAHELIGHFPAESYTGQPLKGPLCQVSER